MVNSAAPAVSLARKVSWWRFAGPAFLVSVGYMDPGNWATDLKGGSKYGLTLLWVVLLSSILAIILQILCVRMSVATRSDLAALCRRSFNKPVSYVLWILAELAIIATDVAEVIGSAVALLLLFNIPLPIGVLITGADVILLLLLLGRGTKPLEALITSLVATVAVCFLINLILAKPDMGATAAALIPRKALTGDALAIAVGILGATVMPHNLYLHSAFARRAETEGNAAEESQAVRSGTWATVGALSAAFFVNAAILVLAATVFFPQGIVVEQLEDAHRLLGPALGSVAPILFGVALLASGQSSTITGTLAGQVVMEGFIGFKMNPALRRFVTRMIALVPAMLLVTLSAGRNVDALVNSQIILSLQLPFAIFPLVWLTSRKDLMGRYASPMWLTGLGYIIATGITALNLNFLLERFTGR